MDDGRRRAALAVAARRGELEWTQQQLATEAHVDVKTIGNLERGDHWPNARNRTRVEKALGWQPGEIERLRTEKPAAEYDDPDLQRVWELSDGLPEDARREIVRVAGKMRAAQRGGTARPA